MLEQYGQEVMALRDRVILGNKKLNDAWKQICQLDTKSQQWNDELECWVGAAGGLSALCRDLQRMKYEDCLYLDERGRKTVKCLGEGDWWCQVCPSRIPYWEQELNLWHGERARTGYFVHEIPFIAVIIEVEEEC